MWVSVGRARQDPVTRDGCYGDGPPAGSDTGPRFGRAGGLRSTNKQ